MGRQTNTSHKAHYRKLPDGGIGCHECEEPATRWIDWERYGIRRWLSTAYCDVHGDWWLRELADPTVRVRPIR
ncbi:hypothetical protein D7D52_16905 [Nocardia yunnanensis]|uniref:Uncharacterized protein n=1 Tax=Nocardia yunnanensis TaxID=2382165 RepID=A0A386ZCD9_9NOCA|nr:hypothetical protein [Nocardia yunnanensis]AYF75270.1 hypothetical protein D7D52_16905 [Nocardia yunnanensis]